MKLTYRKIKNLTEPGRYGDGGGLYLRVAPGGSKQWVQRITIKKNRHDLGLGGWPLISLQEAREKSFELRREVYHGGNPLAGKHKADTPTFREAAERTFEALRPRWKSEKVAYNWMHRLERHAMAHLADLPVDAIGREDILKVLSPIWAEKPETGRKVRRYLKQVFSWAQAHGHVEHNLAGEAIDGALPSMPSVKQNFRALPYQEVGEALEIIRASRASMSAKACLEFVILTACRSGEARLAEWSEIDLAEREWRIPASRMKSGKEHRQPLSAQAVEVLERVRSLSSGEGLIFPSPVRKGQELSNMSLTKILRDNGLAARCVVHGFRSSFRTWAAEKTNADHAVMELCLAHAVGSSVEQAYARSDLFAKRARLMEQWGRFVAGGERGKVIAIRGA